MRLPNPESQLSDPVSACRCWLPETHVTAALPSNAHLISSYLAFSPDALFAAALIEGGNSAAELCTVLVVLPIRTTGTEPAHALTTTGADFISEYQWVPGTHALLILGRLATMQLARIDMDAALPAGPVDLLWHTTPAGPDEEYVVMDVLPAGAAAILLSCKESPGSAVAHLALHDSTTLECTRSWAREVPGPVEMHQPSVHAATHAVAACLGPCTCVWAFDGAQLGDVLFVHSKEIDLFFSEDSRFCQGIERDGDEDNAAERLLVLDALTGTSLLELPAGHDELMLSSTWAGPDDSQLHFCTCREDSQWSESERACDEVLSLHYWVMQFGG